MIPAPQTDVTRFKDAGSSGREGRGLEGTSRSDNPGNASLFRRLFPLWYVVAVSFHVLVLYPFLEVGTHVVSLPDQVVGHAFFLTAWMLAALLWTGLLTAVARISSLLKGSDKPRKFAIRISSSVALSLFLYLLVVFTYHAARGGSDEFHGLLDLLFVTPSLGISLAVLVAFLYVTLGTRWAIRIEAVVERMRRFGGACALGTVPFIIVFLVQALRISLPPERLPPVHPPPGTLSNIIVVVMDAMPMSKTSLYPGAEDLTPNLKRFAERSFVFANAFSPANFTTPSVTTLLTGKQPTNHGIYLVKMSLKDAARRESLPAEFQRAGFATAATVANPEAHPRQLKVEGFDRVFPMRGIGWEAGLESAAIRLAGFHLANMWSFSLEHWLTFHIPDPGQEHPWPSERNFSDALEYLSGGGKPRFVYIHVMSPHSPYLADPPFLYARMPIRGFMDTRDSYGGGVVCKPFPESDREPIGMLEKRFEESVLSVDHRLGRFLDRLEATGRFEDSIIVVLSDHGEMFEPRWVGHNCDYLDDVLVHVPLLIHLPGQKEKRTVVAPIGLVDVAPTLLDLERIPVPPWMDGISWKPVFSGAPAPGRPSISYTWDAILSLRRGDADSGTVRMTWGDSRAMLSLSKRNVVVTGPRGEPRVFSFDDPRELGSVIGTGSGSFEEALRLAYPRIPSNGAERASGTVP